MRITRSNIIPDVLILEPEVIHDERGRFLEEYRVRDLVEALGAPVSFVQSNTSYLIPGALQGIHFQTRNPQGKLVRCISGRIQQVSVDLREGSPYFGKHIAILLDDMSCRSVYCPVGFGSAFLAPSGGHGSTVIYHCTSYHLPEYDKSLRWNDPDLDIKWLTQGRNPILSRKDRAGLSFREISPIQPELHKADLSYRLNVPVLP